MPGPDPRTEIIREWVLKAENDLMTAAHSLRLEKNCPTDTVCFHAQQCVEKYLKALLVFHGVAFPRTHDVGELLTLLPVSLAFVPSTEDQRRLVSYATVTRYPGDYESISLSEARRAVAVARRVRRAVRALLPTAALKKSKS